jgi:predicted RNA-binding protein YlxR (DUF448 family)
MNRGHIPHRMCVGCRSVKPKKELIRLVSCEEDTCDGDSVTIDTFQRLRGRGFYLCPMTECLQKALKRNSLKTCLNRSSFVEAMNSLSDSHT